MHPKVLMSAGVVLVGLVGWAVLAQSQERTPAGGQGEYQELPLSATVSAMPVLNRLGAQGWELVGVTSACRGDQINGTCLYWAYLKRPK